MGLKMQQKSWVQPAIYSFVACIRINKQKLAKTISPVKQAAPMQSGTKSKN